MTTPQIGPYTFAGMRGHLVPASAPVVATRWGMRPGRRRAKVSQLVTVEEVASVAEAWLKAYTYRTQVGALASPVIDHGGQRCDYALIQDVAASIKATTYGAVLRTTWSIIPPIWFGDFGAATTSVPGVPLGRTMAARTASPSADASFAVGSVQFDSATGDFLTPITTDQAKDVLSTGKSLGVDNVATEPVVGGGMLTSTVLVASSAVAAQIARACRYLVGTITTVRVGGITFFGVGVQDVDIDWSDTGATSSSGKSTLLTASWSFGIDQTSDDTKQSKTQSVMMVETASVWGQWEQAERALCDTAEEGIGCLAGSASFAQPVGPIEPPSNDRGLLGLRSDGALGLINHGSPANVQDPTDYTGRWVRISVRRGADGKPVTVGGTPRPIWYGVAMRRSIVGGTDTASSECQHVCAGLLHALSQVYLYRWYDQSQDATAIQGPADPGEVLPFNGEEGGDASSNARDQEVFSRGRSTINGKSVVVHDRRRKSPFSGDPYPAKWSAHEAVTTILAAYADQYPTAIPIALDGQTAALDYEGSWDLTNRSMADMLCEIINPRNGATFRLMVNENGDGWTLMILSTSGDAVTVPGGPDIPATAYQHALLDLTTASQYEVARDRSAQVDRLYVSGDYPWLGMTLAISTAKPEIAQFAKGWTVADETAWDAADATARNTGRLANVWRRWVLAPAWDGKAWIAPLASDSTADGTLSTVAAFCAVRRVATDAVHGVEGEIGLVQSGGPRPQSATVRLTRYLPVSTQGAGTPPPTGGVQPEPGLMGMEPPLVAYDPSARTYEDKAGDWRLTVDDAGGAILLGDDSADAASIKEYLAAGKTIATTLGVIGQVPWRVSWRRADTDQPRTLPRSLILPFPDQMYRLIVQSSLVGLTNSTTPTRYGSDDQATGSCKGTDIGFKVAGVPRLEPIMRVHRLWHEPSLCAITWRQDGVIADDELLDELNDPPADPAKGDTYRIGSTPSGVWTGHSGKTATYTGTGWRLSDAALMAPGTWILQAKVPTSDRTSYTETVGAMVTARRWDFRQQATTWTCERARLGVDRSTFAMAVPPIIAKPAVGAYK